MRVAFNQPYLTGRELEYIQEGLTKDTGSDGHFTQLVTTYLEQQTATQILLTTSATHALEMAMLLLELTPADEVLMPSFTFPSTANAVVLRGARPIFAEINPATLNIDPHDLARRITPRTRGIIVVHYGGISCDLISILEMARRHNLWVVEDAAQAVNSFYRGKSLGTYGDLGCYSFHHTKNFVAGEGGALLINNNNLQLVEKAEQIRQKGTNRMAFRRGEIARYTWLQPGSNYAPSDLLMALLYSQLELMEEITARRKVVYEQYQESLHKYVDQGWIRIPFVPEGCQPNYHLFYIILSQESVREQVRQQLNQCGIEALTHFEPLHSSAMGQKLGYNPGDLPITTQTAKGLLRLPLHACLTGEQVEYVLATLGRILEGIFNG